MKNEEMNENELVVSLLVESIEADNIWSASHKIKTIIHKLVPITFEQDISERDYLEAFALRLLANKFKKQTT